MADRYRVHLVDIVGSQWPPPVGMRVVLMGPVDSGEIEVLATATVGTVEPYEPPPPLGVYR